MSQRVFRTLLEHLDSTRRWSDGAAVKAVLDPVRRPAEAQGEGQGFMLFAELARHLRSPGLDAAAKQASGFTNGAPCMHPLTGSPIRDPGSAAACDAATLWEQSVASALYERLRPASDVADLPCPAHYAASATDDAQMPHLEKLPSCQRRPVYQLEHAVCRQ